MKIDDFRTRWRRGRLLRRVLVLLLLAVSVMIALDVSVAVLLTRMGFAPDTVNYGLVARTVFALIDGLRPLMEVRT